MPELFVDTWFFVGRYDTHDDHHRRVRLLEQRFRDAMLVTHDLVCAEFLAYRSGEGEYHRRESSGAVREFMRRGIAMVADRPLFLRALNLYERRADKEYSLVDCMSMVVMRERGITHVLTSDHHVSQEGFTVVSE